MLTITLREFQFQKVVLCRLPVHKDHRILYTVAGGDALAWLCVNLAVMQICLDKGAYGHVLASAGNVGK